MVSKKRLREGRHQDGVEERTQQTQRAPVQVELEGQMALGRGSLRENTSHNDPVFELGET